VSEPSEYCPEMRVFELSVDEGVLEGHNREYYPCFPIGLSLQYFSQTHFNRAEELSDLIVAILVGRVRYVRAYPAIYGTRREEYAHLPHRSERLGEPGVGAVGIKPVQITEVRIET